MRNLLLFKKATSPLTQQKMGLILLTSRFFEQNLFFVISLEVFAHHPMLAKLCNAKS
jgi:hypothetical protein